MMLRDRIVAALEAAPHPLRIRELAQSVYAQEQAIRSAIMRMRLTGDDRIETLNRRFYRLTGASYGPRPPESPTYTIRRPPWTEEQTRLAQDLHAHGSSGDHMERILGRSKNAIQTHLSRHKSGIRKPVSTVFSEWTSTRNERLVESVIAGQPIREIAVMLGSTESAVQGQAYRLGIFQKQLAPSVKDRIIELAVEGATLGRISRQTGVPEPGIRFILSRAGASLRTQSPSYRGPDARRASR